VASEGLFDPGRGGWDFADDTTPVAGEYIATHVDLQGVSQGQLQALQTKLTQTQAKLTAGQFSVLTKEDLSGDILYSAVLSYFAANQAASQVSSQAVGIVEYRKPSFGNFLASAKTLYWFGIPRNVAFPGVIMDINRYASMNVAKDNNPATAIDYNKLIGMNYSANEHLIPEKLFTNPADPNRPQGVSAMKALSLAARQGQKVYTLNAANQTNHATLLAQVTIDPQAMAEIQNALAAGKEVTVHQLPITQSGWTGSGYIITDPATGAGAYKISGGANGAALVLFFIAVALAIVLPFIVLSAAGAGAALFAAFLSGLNLKGLIQAFTAYSFDQNNLTPEQRDARLGMLSLLSIGISVLAILNAPRQVFDKYIVEGLLLSMAATWAKLLNSI
jgi:hypothetical protein